MTSSLPPQRPEGEVLQSALAADGRSIRQIAVLAGMSEARWRQIVKGSMSVNGHLTEVVAPPMTLARMAHALNVTPKQLKAVGREDAATILEHLHKEPRRDASGPPLRAPTGRVAEELDMIYGSKTMTDQEKLVAIGQVLRLYARLEAEADAAQSELAVENDKQHDQAR